MTKPKHTAKRIRRALTSDEQQRLDQARAVAASERDDILREGRIAKQAWLATRRQLDATIEQLSQERKRQGLSLADIEQKTGLRKSALSRLENDKTSNPTLFTLQRYATALGLVVQQAVVNENS